MRFDARKWLVLVLVVCIGALASAGPARAQSYEVTGFAQNLTEGILRLRYRTSQERPELVNPGETYHINIDMVATSNVFRAGHRLRLEESSSNFPRFDRNLNTGEEQARGTRMIKATNLVYHDKGRPSALIVPVVP
jgi:putative CocE/NonD family hydrolase